MPENVILLLKKRGLLPSLNPALEKIALYILNNPQKVKLLRIKDLAIGICNSGRMISTVNALKRAKDIGATTICITNFDQILITKYADIRLFSSTQDSAFFQESMVSRVARMIIIDILYAGLAIRTFDTAIKKIEKSSASLRNFLM